MPAGWARFLAGILTRINVTHRHSAHSKTVRGLSPRDKKIFAQSLFDMLSPRNQAIALEHAEGVDKFLDMVWNGSIKHLRDHNNKAEGFQIGGRNEIRAQAEDNYTKREELQSKLAGRTPNPIPAYWSKREAVPEAVPEAAPEAVPEGPHDRFSWLSDFAPFFRRYGGFRPHTDENRLIFEVQPGLPAHLLQKAAERAVVYMLELKGEVLKIGCTEAEVFMDNVGQYCNPFPEIIAIDMSVSRLAVAKTIHAAMTANPGPGSGLPLLRLRDANNRGASGVQQASWRAKKDGDRRQAHREGMRARVQKSSRRQGAALQFCGGR